ncbi:3-hydroxyacyl-CoA dehydrogenase type-2-like [Paramacrobiotus metropolitanus]|uniref:3-hydroxyacyl-CoA dehydrogenase type-2-like n=1 Tax=Paramacrobiotus metropolitanus TaxID=2943436 RepID=UPI002445ED71|nr:3-hydroxyacyl-CoA dehydrogenase type-2-like [Paramacrobiotus metropolitanus]
MATNLQGFVALVTGGACGLGRASVDLLASKGVIVFVLDMEQVIKNQEHVKSPGQVHFRAGDVTSEESVTKILEEIRTAYNRLDIVLNCAGIMAIEPLYDFKADKPLPMEKFTRIYNVNVFGTVNVARLAVGLMAKNQPDAEGQRGVIINVASCVRKDGPAWLIAYSSSKSAVDGMTIPMAREFGPQGIRVVAIAPGPCGTGMVRQFDGLEDACVNIAVCPKRNGKPEDFARLVQYTVENPYINGTTIALDGGFTNPVSLAPP